MHGHTLHVSDTAELSSPNGGNARSSVPAADPTRWGLAAVAESGTVNLAVDERLDREAYVLTLDAGSIHLRFSLRGRQVAAEALRFLTVADAGPAELPLGSDPRSPATLVRDAEFAGRYFLRLSGGDHTVTLTLADGSLGDFTAALADVAEQLA